MELLSQSFFDTAEEISEKNDNFRDLAVILSNVKNFEMRIFLGGLNINNLIKTLADADISHIHQFDGQFINGSKIVTITDEEVQEFAHKIAAEINFKENEEISRKILASYLLNFSFLIKVFLISKKCPKIDEENLEVE